MTSWEGVGRVATKRINAVRIVAVRRMRVIFMVVAPVVGSVDRMFGRIH